MLITFSSKEFSQFSHFCRLNTKVIAGIIVMVFRILVLTFAVEETFLPKDLCTDLLMLIDSERGLCHTTSIQPKYSHHLHHCTVLFTPIYSCCAILPAKMKPPTNIETDHNILLIYYMVCVFLAFYHCDLLQIYSSSANPYVCNTA